MAPSNGPNRRGSNGGHQCQWQPRAWNQTSGWGTNQQTTEMEYQQWFTHQEYQQWPSQTTLEMATVAHAAEDNVVLVDKAKYEIPAGFTPETWVRNERTKPYMIYLKDPTGLTEAKIWCRLCGRNAECDSHMMGKDHLYHTVGVDGQGSDRLHDQTKWKQPMISSTHGNVRSRVGVFGNQRAQMSSRTSPINHQQQMPRTTASEPTSSGAATSGAEPAGQPPLESNHQPASGHPVSAVERGRSREIRALNTMNNASNHEDQNSVKPESVLPWSEEPCATSETTPKALKLEKPPKLETPKEEEWQPPQEEEERHAPSAPELQAADAAAGAQNVAAEPTEAIHPEDDAYWMRTMNQRQQGSKRPVPDDGPDGVLKRICQALDELAEITAQTATNIRELQAHGEVNTKLSSDQHANQMARTDSVRTHIADIRSLVDRMHSTPETLQMMHTPETPQNALQQVTAPQTAQTAQNGSCMPGCASCINCWKRRS